jgi:hypothetical protein
MEAEKEKESKRENDIEGERESMKNIEKKESDGER